MSLQSLYGKKGMRVARGQRWPLTVILILLLAAINCNTVMQLGAGDSGAAARYDVARDDAIFLLGGQPRTLDPALTLGGPDSPLGHIFSGLVALDTDLQVQPELAAGWDISDDGTRYTFYLRRNAVFHDGRPVTAADVVYSWERATDPATASDTAATYLGDIVGVPAKLAGEAGTIGGIDVIDDHTLEVNIDAPKVYFLAKLAYPVAYVVDRANVTAADWEHAPNGTGPFRLQAWEDDEIIVLARHDDYYLAPAQVAHVVYLLGPGLPLSMYENGQIDFVGVGGSTRDRLQDPNDPLYSELRTGVDMCTSYIGFNHALPPLDDVRVRQALNLALDRERLVSGVLDGYALPAQGLLPPGMPGYGGDLPSTAFDPEQARALLADAGYGPGELPPLTFTTAGYGDVGGYLTAIITMWEENLGVTVEPILLDPFTYQDELYAGNVGHFYSYGWCADYPDPQNFLDILFHSESPQNLGRYHNEAVDAALEEARVMSDTGQRLARYQAIEANLVEDGAAAFISHSLDAVLVKPYVRNYVWTPMGVRQWHRVALERQP